MIAISSDAPEDSECHTMCSVPLCYNLVLQNLDHVKTLRVITCLISCLMNACVTCVCDTLGSFFSPHQCSVIQLLPNDHAMCMEPKTYFYQIIFLAKRLLFK